MKNIATLLAFLLPVSLFAQIFQSQSSTYAVVVGISDYQDEGIPDLRFADKDALAFAGFLQSYAGGSLDEDHLKVLINEKATAAQFAIALDWLWEVVKENDKVIIYFSGHGDVERKSITQPGYLLCWDAPSRVYMAGGAFNVRDLNDVVSTLSVQNKAKVILVTDACRAGKLSGSGIGGSQATAANLAKQYANEIKILSCQPDEFSIEGEQWGGGRGAFSYHLLDGLYGMADGNDDLSVNLLEIGRYLEDHVPTEVAPQSQIPMTVGSRGEKLTTIYPEILEQLKEGKRGQMQMFTATESRGIEDNVLAEADSNIVEMYLAFKESISKKDFLEPANACTEFYYEKISQEPQLEKLHSSMRRNYAAALQDDAQQVMNIMLKSGLTELVLKNLRAKDIYQNYPTYLERAAELLGERHYMHSMLYARKSFFEGIIINEKKDKQAAFHRALSLQADMAHAMVYLVNTFEKEEVDSAKYYFQKSADLIPSWVEPYIALANFYLYNLRDFSKAEKMLNLAGQTDSTSLLVWYNKAWLYDMHGDFEIAEKWYLKTIEGTSKDICFPCAHIGLGGVYQYLDRFTEAEQQIKKAIQLDSTFAVAYNNLGLIYQYTNRLEEAEQHFIKAIQLGFTHANNLLGILYYKTQHYDKAEEQYKIAIQLDSADWQAYMNLAFLYQRLEKWNLAKENTQKAMELLPDRSFLYALLGNAYAHLPNYIEDAEFTLNKAIQMDADYPDTYVYLAQWSIKNNQLEEAWQYLEEGLEKGLDNGELDREYLSSQPDFEAMRKDPKWKTLIEKYFPEEVKE